MDVYKVDLNLLKLFDALLKEGSVTGAGERLGLSQPAASRGLGRLRDVLNDRIIVRTAKGWELTPKALSLSSQVVKLLDDARAIVVPSEFCPDTATGRFTLASSDHLALLLVPQIVNRLRDAAPGMDLVIPPPSGDNVGLVARGEADFAIGAFEGLPARFYQRSLYEDDFVCVLRQGHPDMNQVLTLEKFISMDHISVIITGQGYGVLDEALKQRGVSRRIMVKTPHFLVAPNIVTESDLVLTIPRRLAQKIAENMPLHICDLPIEIPKFKPSMIWHEKLHYDPAHIWFRNQIVEIARW